MATSYYTPVSVPVAATETITLYTGFTSMSGAHQKMATSLLISRLHRNPTNPLITVASTLACFCSALPGMTTHLSDMTSVNVIVKTLTESDIEWIAGDTSLLPSGGHVTEITRILPVQEEAAGVEHQDGIYAALASLLMVLGRQPGSGPEASAVKARPRALIDGFKIPDYAQVLLPGRELGPSLDSMETVYSSFANYTEARMKVVQYFLGISSGHLPKHLTILMTNFNLMRGAQMTHVGVITKFAQMHPWTVKIPELAPYYQKFAKELEAFSKIPIHYRNYHRLLVAPSDFMFLSSEYKPLIAVAGSFVEEVETNYAGYVYNSAEFVKLIAKVRQYEPNQSAYLGTSHLAAALGVPDMSLPGLKSSQPPLVRPMA